MSPTPTPSPQPSGPTALRRRWSHFLSGLLLALKLLGAVLGTLALVAIFSIGGGVERYMRYLGAVMDVYASVIAFYFGWIFDLVVETVAGILVSLLRRYIEVGDHWKHAFTFLTLYAFADSFQFFGRKDAKAQDPTERRWLPISNESRMGLTSVVTGFCLALLAAVAVGMAPVDRSLGSGLVMIVASVGAIFLYWIVIALAHARWNRWNYAHRDKPPEAVEPFGYAFRKRAGFAVRRSLAGLVIGLVVFLIARKVSPAPAPGLIALGVLALALGLLWIARAVANASGDSLKARWRGARKNHNYGMGRDIAVRVVLAAGLSLANAVIVAD